MAQQASVMFQGKQIELFTENQLMSLKREALVQRGMSLRDAIGQDNLPPMPRQQEALTEWIINVQSVLTKHGEPAAYQGGGPPGEGAYAAPEGMPIRDDLSEAQQAFVDAKMAQNAARQRNHGGGMAGIFGGE
eukprot:CAMPEP_0197653406 /NCGR_PEP_ID=MMETSP1338-20131121/35399_1 /TAXON_ID=43686 ORGANISM="Pelagodinium beii, Strain RCC1491" /NCGR_SAMPLE_ID=MMETSP1338 /ASSEMBLY_ACC=CAM_ASM_000754 /LENGTH=132 /DNA_ID=CAMNT_0043228509 /DNA_START=55 /DNA_END=453 /DNA_ORIENTATION=+